MRTAIWLSLTAFTLGLLACGGNCSHWALAAGMMPSVRISLSVSSVPAPRISLSE